MKKKIAKKHKKHGLGCLWGHLVDLKNWALDENHLLSILLILWGGGLVLKCCDPWVLTGSLGILWGIRGLLKK